MNRKMCRSRLARRHIDPFFLTLILSFKPCAYTGAQTCKPGKILCQHTGNSQKGKSSRCLYLYILPHTLLISLPFHWTPLNIKSQMLPFSGKSMGTSSNPEVVWYIHKAPGFLSLDLMLLTADAGSTVWVPNGARSQGMKLTQGSVGELADWLWRKINPSLS